MKEPVEIPHVFFNVDFQLLLESPFLCFEDSSSFHYLSTSLTQKGIALFPLLIIIIFPFFLPFGHYTARVCIPRVWKEIFEMFCRCWKCLSDKKCGSSERVFLSTCLQNVFKQCQTWKILPILMSKWYLQCMCCSPIHITPVCTAEGRQGQQGLAYILKSFGKYIRSEEERRDKDVATGDLLAREHFLSQLQEETTSANGTLDIYSKCWVYICWLMFAHSVCVCLCVCVSTAVLRACKGLAKWEPGGTLDLCSMHSTYSGNCSF